MLWHPSGGRLPEVQGHPQALISCRLHGGIRTVKALLFFLLASASLANAALIAHMATDRGTVTVELQHDSAPQAVANFMTLAQGTRSRVNPLTGAVTTSPLYIGEKFFRTANSAAFKFAQTGSGTGTNSGSPGFTFRDEFTPAVRHTGYTLSSANAGPNTNGGQIFFTGNATIPQYDDVHSIIGRVVSPASRAVVDAIITAGDNATTITGISFERTDPAAMAFDELAQGLPEVSSTTGSLSVIAQTSVTFTPKSPLVPVSQLRSFRSTNLSTWAELSPRFVGNQSPPLSSSVIDNASLSRAFYRLSHIRYPDDHTISSLASATLVATVPGTTITYSFNAAGTGGTVSATNPGAPDDTDAFILLAQTVSPYRSVLTIDNGTAVDPRYIRYTAHSDVFAPSQSAGRVSLEFFNGFFWQALISGTHTLTR
jgi:peptidyl-prolyl cis-trans isomerase A (cyclophilin A)